jgi:hypothetical protein
MHFFQNSYVYLYAVTKKSATLQKFFFSKVDFQMIDVLIIDEIYYFVKCVTIS